MHTCMGPTMIFLESMKRMCVTPHHLSHHFLVHIIALQALLTILLFLGNLFQLYPTEIGLDPIVLKASH